MDSFDQSELGSDGIAEAIAGNPSGGIDPDWLAIGRGVPERTHDYADEENIVTNRIWFLVAAIAFLALSLAMI